MQDHLGTPLRFQLPQRLYGRDTHVATLLQGFGRVAQGRRSELILVRGYSGIGKSSVVSELRAPVVRRGGFFLSGKSDQFQRDIPYATLAQAIGGLTQQLLAAPGEELARWRERLSEAWGELGQVLVDVVPQLERVVGRQPAVPELPASESKLRFHRVCQKFLGVFATPEHPLVVFLDDLQWADLASLELLRHLLIHPETPPLLLIGAFRDNEVSASHPLALALAELRVAGVRMTDLQLEPLSREHIQQLVADSLPGAGEGMVGPFAALVHEKTGGNPFFLTQFMLTLHHDGLLTRTPEGGWRWDAAGVRAKDYSDNVVDFMVSRLRQLPVRAQHLLQLAACVGNVFQRQLLVIISGAEPSEVEAGLEEALQEGMLVRVGSEQCRFLHDRIQQAAYELIPAQERKAVHLRIGRLMLASLSPEEVREKIFDVVGQLNAAAELIVDERERHRVARLNAEAGWKARASTAFRSAADSFALAFTFIPGDPWETDPELAFKLQLDRAHSEFMSGNAAEARRLVAALLPRIRTRADLAAVYRLESDLHLAANEIESAGTCLLEGLAQMGMPMSPHPSREEVVAANEEVWALMGERSIESLVELPLMTDPDKKALMDLLSALFTPAIFTDANLLVLHLCRMLSLSLRYGNTEASVHGFGWYGLMLGAVFKRYREGHAFSVLARELVERHAFTAARGRALYSLEMTSCWVQPLSFALEYVRDAFHHALRGGDFQIACYCSNHIVTDRLMLGHPLEEVYQESVARLEFARQAGYPAVEDVIHHVQRYVQQLRGLSRSFDTMSGDDFDQEAFEAGLTPQHMSTMRCWYWIIKMQSRFMCGAYAQVLEAGERADELIGTSLGHIQLLSFHLYRALALAACYPTAAPETQRRYLEAMRAHQGQLAEWAGHCPENFRAPERMVSAELFRVTGQMEEALRAYEEAIHSARVHGFIQNVGLANELAARFWREHQAPTLSDAYARQAREAYLKWGALGKVRHLDAQWTHLVPLTVLQAPLAGAGGAQQLDALAVVSAQQAISGELDLERLAATLVRVAVENAGAQLGALLLVDDDKLTVAALSGMVKEDLPGSLLSYVKRAGEHVLVADASLPHPFLSESCFERGRLRSVLCLPLMRQDALQGVLYLANTQAPHAFTPARLSLLGQLASHAAISLENARRHAEVQRAEASLRQANEELAQRLEERAWELRQAQARLMDATREAGLSDVAANVLHNVGNVLTSAVLNTHMLREKVDASRMVRLKQLTVLLEEHQDDLAGFLTKDPRGTQLMSYLFGLADELLREHASMKESLGKLKEHIEHMRAILHVQQTHGRHTLLPEECELSQLVEDALSIQLPALQRHGITVTRELQVLPKARLDKHRVLQILINLITNARNAMSGVPEARRRLHVRLDAEGGTARIQVVDSGKGIAAEHRERLFSQGFTTRTDGQGLGLYSSALAAKSLGGRLTLESEGPGKGATATLELPLA
ncbi:trifunctional serine/threonine-protein kinase/ATP-binding protein/sensor histidine kinase [Archangium violaceum]|uniref:trifunctional serine/threonine-protein kinase/ATP-binding protein/sensor histidine kinase n=1 Tax=Archangium violaceum TaxID=83451 RepID=UPI001EF547B0|nr:AAA family ATPase [Archangium violaceum]